MTKIINVPGINGLGKTVGCENAFEKIFDRLKETHSSENGKPFDRNLLGVEEVSLNYNIEEDNKIIYDKSFEVLSQIANNERVLFVGGDHSISYPLTRAFFDESQSSGKEPCLVVFDAHADCMIPMKEPTHEEWLRKLVEDGFPPGNILLVGVRNMWKDEVVFLRENKIRVLSVNRFLDNVDETIDTIMEFASGKELYVSIDIDAVDPSFAPGTGYREVGGLTSRQFIYLIQRMSKMKNLRAVDLVEINPEKDRDDLTVKLGAKVVAELI